MELAIIGLGKMGKNIALRLLEKRHTVIGYDVAPEPAKEIAKKGGKAASSIEELFKLMKSKPKVVWSMLPSGNITEQILEQLKAYLSKGDIVIDGGNSNYKDTVRRAEAFSKLGIKYMDVGTSGGVVAAKLGYCLMIGGDKETFLKLEPIFKSLACEKGYGYMGPSGSGHYVKMVHNAIEYGMMQAIGEGFDLLSKSPYEKDLDFKKIAGLWNHGSIVRGFLMEMIENAFTKDPRLDKLLGYVDDTGEGRWSIQEAIDRNVPFNVITASLYARFNSKDANKFWAKTLAAMRNEFGGHAVKEK